MSLFDEKICATFTPPVIAGLAAGSIGMAIICGAASCCVSEYKDKLTLFTFAIVFLLLGAFGAIFAGSHDDCPSHQTLTT